MHCTSIPSKEDWLGIVGAGVVVVVVEGVVVVVVVEVVVVVVLLATIFSFTIIIVSLDKVNGRKMRQSDRLIRRR
jgi:uncharacterized membrane protein YcjF (UPF0283 family)